MPQYNRKLLREELTRDEGIRLKPYLCSKKRWTIGVGRNLQDKGLSDEECFMIFGTFLKGNNTIINMLHRNGVTFDQAMTMLDNDVAYFEAALDRNIKWWRNLSDPQQRGLINMAFNMGVSDLMCFQNTLASLQKGDSRLIAIHARDSVWYRELTPRAERVIRLLVQV